MIHRHTSGGRAAILSAAATFAVITAASAAVKTWDGGGADNNWQTGPTGMPTRLPQQTTNWSSPERCGRLP